MTSTIIPIGGLPGHCYDPEPAPAAQTVTLSRYDAEQITDLLATCEEFFRTASNDATDELADYLAARGNHRGVGYLIDILGFNGLHLHRQLNQTPADRRQEQIR